MKKSIRYFWISLSVSLSIMFIFALGLFLGYSNDYSEDSYVGEYISIDETDGILKISKTKDSYYDISMEFYDLTKIIATGEIENGTLIYKGTDKFGNIIYGNIEEYGADYPIRVEMYGYGLSDEIEFERK